MRKFGRIILEISWMIAFVPVLVLPVKLVPGLQWRRRWRGGGEVSDSVNVVIK